MCGYHCRRCGLTGSLSLLDLTGPGKVLGLCASVRNESRMSSLDRVLMGTAPLPMFALWGLKVAWK